jgi:hypothetical protein
LVALFDQPLGLAGHARCTIVSPPNWDNLYGGEGSAITAKTLLAFDPLLPIFRRFFRCRTAVFKAVRTALEDGA